MSLEGNTLDMQTDKMSDHGDVATADPKDKKKAGATPSKRRLESRRKLVAAARTLFIEKGYHGTRPQDISKMAGVGHGTFYLHFTDKLECFLAFANEACDELGAFTQAHMKENSTPMEQLREIIAGVVDYSNANPGVLSAALTNTNVLTVEEVKTSSPMERWSKNWADLIVRWRDEGVWDDRDDDADPLFIGHLIVGAIGQGLAYGFLYDIESNKLIDDITRSLMRSMNGEV
jgi:AcrR family transcriptional regulator